MVQIFSLYFVLFSRHLILVLFHLGSEFLNDFFKPINTEMDHLRNCKKFRHGRRIKQLEKFEQKMKEERQKRIRERQKEFFGEIEVHKYVLSFCPVCVNTFSFLCFLRSYTNHYFHFSYFIWFVVHAFLTCFLIWTSGKDWMMRLKLKESGGRFSINMRRSSTKGRNASIVRRLIGFNVKR